MGAVFDDDPARWGENLLGVQVVGGVTKLKEQGYRRGVIAIGSNETRQRIANVVQEIEWVTVVHPHASVESSVCLGSGTVVFAGAVIQPLAQVGEHAIVNTGATVDHECVIGSFAHIAPGAHLAGQVEVGEGAFIGIGASVIQRCRIGEWTTVGAGAAVIADLPAYVTAVGVPAKVIMRSRISDEGGCQ